MQVKAIIKIYTIPYLIAAALVVYGYYSARGDLIKSGISLAIFLTLALIGSLIGRKKSIPMKSSYLYLFAISLILFVALYLVFDSYLIAALALFVPGVYFLITVVRERLRK
ncbi:MAG: hypothetical protein ACK5L5_07520 [Bacteroidales bacterium]